MSTVDPKEISATAYLISAAAGRLQAPRRWDEQGIYAVVRRLIDEGGRAPLDVAAAATRAVIDAAANTPAALSWSKYYDSPSASAPQAEAEPICSHCSRSRRGHDKIAELDPHEWSTLAPSGPRRPLPNWRELLP